MLVVYEIETRIRGAKEADGRMVNCRWSTRSRFPGRPTLKKIDLEMFLPAERRYHRMVGVALTSMERGVVDLSLGGWWSWSGGALGST